MNKRLSCAKTISKQLDEDHSELLEDNNLHHIFMPINTLKNLPRFTLNRTICFIIYAYDPESGWLSLDKDRTINKKEILENLGANFKDKYFTDVLNNVHEEVGACIFNFLNNLKDWRWGTIYNLLEWASNNEALASQKTADKTTIIRQNKEGAPTEHEQDVDLESILKNNKIKGALLDEAVSKRRQADALLKELEKDYAHTDNATVTDFSFQFSTTAKSKRSLSWSEHIRNKKKTTAA